MKKGELVRLLKNNGWYFLRSNTHEEWAKGSAIVRLHKSGKLKPGDMHRVLKTINATNQE